MSVAILISTCDRFRRLARWTAGRLDELWENHPPVFFSGLSGSERSGDLPRRSDERDWMAVTRDAVMDLAAERFSAVYLILEDHPPLGRCHANFLNSVLPAALETWGAANIGLLGYGQHRPALGPIRPEALGMEEVPSNDRWRFSLHPALWTVESLLELLDIRMQQYEAGQRTPWAFERHRDDGPVFSSSSRANTFRIRGERFEFEPSFSRRRRHLALRRFVCDVALLGVRMTRGWESRQRLAADSMWLYAFYSGPYPLFWSGLMVQGRPSEHLRRYLGVFPDRALAEGLEKI